jgi:hypothetical protein
MGILHIYARNCLPTTSVKNELNLNKFVVFSVPNIFFVCRGVLTALGGFIILLSFAIQYSYSNLNTYITSYLRTTG